MGWSTWPIGANAPLVRGFLFCFWELISSSAQETHGGEQGRRLWGCPVDDGRSPAASSPSFVLYFFRSLQVSNPVIQERCLDNASRSGLAGQSSRPLYGGAVPRGRVRPLPSPPSFSESVLGGTKIRSKPPRSWHHHTPLLFLLLSRVPHYGA